MREVLIRAIAEALRQSFTLEELMKLQKMLQAGELTNLFPEALKQAIKNQEV